MIDGLRGFIKHLPNKPTCMVLGGGYSTICLVRETLLELGKELDITFYQYNDKKPVAAGAVDMAAVDMAAVDMAANPDIVESRVLRSSYSILTKYPWSPKQEKLKPQAD
ncbi:hypothetical protein EAF04_008410 [Stromatinia cepivora]|nr:hypothetical protein EAF04_008410 [Stromatinia cepivora]